MLNELFFSGFLGKRVHLGVTGSIAAYKALDVLRALTKLGVTVSATVTDSAQEFVAPLSFVALGADPVYSSLFDSDDDIYSHLAPGRTCDCLAVVPVTANTMAKMAGGIADTMLTCQALSFLGPVVLAPAMNPNLWEAPATKANLATLQNRGVDVVFPEIGDVACGDTGKGRLADTDQVIARILKAISPQDLDKKRILLTLGPTREHFDAVRFWSNPSTGRMGGSLALAAWMRGADVTVVAGPTSLDLPRGIHVVEVETAKQMHDAVMDCWADNDIGCATAAVADFAPVPFKDGKYKKEGNSEQVDFSFTRNPDILQAMGASKTTAQKLIGFAAETHELEANAALKLENKNLDLIVANQIGGADAGFETKNNTVIVLDRDGRKESWPTLPKSEVAWRIWDHLLLI